MVVEVVDLVAAGQEVGHGRRRGLIGDGRRDDVDDVAVVVLDGDVHLGLCVEAAKSREMDVAAENGGPNRELGAYALEPVDQVVALLLVRPGRVMVVQVIEEIHAPVEAVEEAAAQADTSVEEFDGSQQGAGKDVFQPCESLEKLEPPEFRQG